MARVEYELTGSELVALLLESSEIKKYQPLFNRAQRRTYFNYGLYSFVDDNGYINLKLMKIIDELNPLYTYSSIQEGREHILNLNDQYLLCQKLTGLYETSGACFHYQIHQCKGACIGEELPKEYNERVRQALENYNFKKQNFFVVDKGRDDGEKAVVKVENGRYVGFGFVNGAVANAGEMHDCVMPMNDNREVRQIIRSFLRKNEVDVVSF